jgi:hypothetical protein
VPAKPSQKKAQSAWDRMEAMGGQGIWDSDMVEMSLADTEIVDDDLAVFRDFPYIEMLDVSNTAITGAGLVHLADLPNLETLIVVGAKISKADLAAFKKAHPNTTVVTKAAPKNAINPFTGKPF